MRIPHAAARCGARGRFCTARSGRLVVVVTPYAAQSPPALDVTGCAAHFFARLNQSVAKALVVSFGVKMAQEPGYGDLQRSFAEEDHALQALLDKEQVTDDQPAPCPHLDRGEIHASL